MWRNPALPAPERRAAPQDSGERLATIARNQGAEELRVSIDTYEGRPYVSIRVWAAGQDGQFWPTKRGTSVRLREIEEVAGALMRARDLVEGQGGPPARAASRPAPRGHLPAPRTAGIPRGELPGLNAPSRDFDEF